MTSPLAVLRDALAALGLLRTRLRKFTSYQKQTARERQSGREANRVHSQAHHAAGRRGVGPGSSFSRRARTERRLSEPLHHQRLHVRARHRRGYLRALLCEETAGAGRDQTVMVENKAGMAGNIATEYVAKSKPDGYTIFIAPASSILVAGPFLYKKLNYDPIKDFTSVTTLAKLPFVLVVAPDIGVNSVPDLVARLKAKPTTAFSVEHDRRPHRVRVVQGAVRAEDHRGEIQERPRCAQRPDGAQHRLPVHRSGHGQGDDGERQAEGADADVGAAVRRAAGHPGRHARSASTTWT